MPLGWGVLGAVEWVKVQINVKDKVVGGTRTREGRSQKKKKKGENKKTAYSHFNQRA